MPPYLATQRRKHPSTSQLAGDGGGGGGGGEGEGDGGDGAGGDGDGVQSGIGLTRVAAIVQSAHWDFNLCLALDAETVIS